MITFLPTPDFLESAAMLDSKRLGNQRVEARMILRWLRNPKDYPRQQNSGYTIMWKGYEEALCLYYNACCEEWARHGGQNIVCQPERVGSRVKLPKWLGDDKLHVTHRSALLYKHPDHYEKYGWAEDISDPKVDYLWPRPVEGKEGEYELCPPAYWKKKKSDKTATSANSKNASSNKRTTGKDDKPATSSKRKSMSNKHTDKEKPKHGPRSAVAKKESAVKKQRTTTPTRRPRRSPRLAKR